MRYQDPTYNGTVECQGELVDEEANYGVTLTLDHTFDQPIEIDKCTFEIVIFEMANLNKIY